VADSAYLRYPHLSGDLITFTAEDDVWLAPLGETANGGGRAWRLTADRVPVLHPRLNPSATRVAWTSTRDGAGSLARGDSREAYTVAVDGGEIQRLTYWGDSLSAVRGWLCDDEVLAISRTGQHNTWRTWAFAVPLDAPARRLPYGPAGDVSISPGGAVLVGSALYAEPSRWKRYGGGTGGKIWYSPDGTEYARVLESVGNHLVNPMWVAGRVAFLSDHEGVGALYSALPDGSDLRRHTGESAYYARHATTDGARVVYQCAGSLWLLESLDAEPTKLDVRLGGVRSGRASFPVSAKSGLGEFELCKTGRVVAAEVRGTLHWLPVEDGPARALVAAPGVRGRLPVVVPGESRVLAVTDAGGEDGLELISTEGEPPRRIGHGQFGRVLDLAVSPDGKMAAAAVADGRLLTIELESGEIGELARSDNAEMHGLAFSPDSAYLVWAQPWRAFEGRHIRMARLADRAVADVTPPRYADASPTFTYDGKYLVFLSNRAYDPVYDSHNFDLGFLPGVRPYLVTLAETTPSPFAPELNGRPVSPEKDAEKEKKAKEADREKGKGDKDGDGGAGADCAADTAAPPVKVDFEGIADRIVPFPVEAGNYADLSAIKGGVVWLALPRTGELGEAIIGASEEHPKARLIRYDLVKRRRVTAVRELDAYAVSHDGGRLAYINDTEFNVMASDCDDDDDTVSVDLDRIRVTVDPPAEWAQMYDEAWRLMRDNFWRADLGGVDWPAMAERYRPLLDRIGSQDDLHDVIWELHGELGASHAYVRPPAHGADAALIQGLLGADLSRDDDGTWRIARVLRGESSVIGARSPLTAPGVGARPGDAVVAVDGRPVDPVRGPNALLGGKADKPVELTLRRPAPEGAGAAGEGGEINGSSNGGSNGGGNSGTQERRVVVVPLASEAALRYQDLIARRRAAVSEASGGRLGYLHVPDMVSSGWAEFHRDMHSQFKRDGLIVDLRENGGGHTSELVVEKLARRIIGWDFGRYNEPNSYPSEAPRGPIVALADEHAGSDGDIVTQALKSYGIAPVVGTRTWGGVIGIDMKYELVDGTGVTQPKFAFWFEDAGWNVENHGVEPDVEVDILPQDWAAGRDPQLETAIRMALEALEARPAARAPELD
jgi:tricorn protease